MNKDDNNYYVNWLKEQRKLIVKEDEKTTKITWVRKLHQNVCPTLKDLEYYAGGNWNTENRKYSFFCFSDEYRPFSSSMLNNRHVTRLPHVLTNAIAGFIL